MTTLTQGRQPGEFLISEANGTLSRDTVTVKSGQSLKAGEVFELDNDSKAVVFNNDSDFGAAGVMFDAVDASSADTVGVAIVRLAEVKADALIVNSDDSDSTVTKTHAIASLAKLNIIARVLVLFALGMAAAFLAPEHHAHAAGLAFAFAGISMDVFNQDAFSTIQLTAAIERIPYTPTLLGQLNIFEPMPIRTEAAAFEMRNGVISLIQTSERAAPLAEQESEKREFRFQQTVRLAKGATIRASEIQNMRAFGSETELMAISTELMRRYNGPTGLVNDLALTWEKHRLGAVQGIVLDADNTTLVNWFTFWNQVQPAEIDFALGTTTTDVIGKCSQVIRQMARASKGAWIEGRTQVHALVGDTFWDMLRNHDRVRDTFLSWEAAMSLRASVVEPTAGQFGEPFYFGGIYFRNYRSTDDYDENITKGTPTVGIPAAKAKFFPVNAPGAFKWFKSPGESFDFANTPGLDYYGIIVRDLQRNMWVRPEVYSYPLFACTRPAMLQRAKAQ